MTEKTLSAIYDEMLTLADSMTAEDLDQMIWQKLSGLGMKNDALTNTHLEILVQVLPAEKFMAYFLVAI